VHFLRILTLPGRAPTPIPPGSLGRSLGLPPPPPLLPALPPAPYCSFGGTAQGCHRPPAAHPPALPGLLRIPHQPAARTYRRRQWPRPEQEKNEQNARKLSVGQPDQGGKQKHSIRAQSILADGV